MDSSAFQRGLRAQLLRDDNPFKHALFQEVLDRSRIVTFIYRLCSAVPALGVLACLGFYAWKILGTRIPTHGGFLALPQYPNERRVLAETLDEDLRAKLAESRGGGPLPRLSVAGLLRLRRFFRALLRRRELFLVLRVAEYVAIFQRLEAADPAARVFLVTTDTNPRGIALLEYARASGRHAAFLSHGEPNAPILPLHCEVAFLFGEVSRERYLAAGARIGRTILRGHRGEVRPYQTVASKRTLDRIVIVLGKFHDPARLLELVRWTRSVFAPAEIALREHPTFPMAGAMRAILLAAGVVRSEVPLLGDDVASSALVLAGNTTSHLEVLLAGKASLYFSDRGDPDYDRYGYVREGLVLPWRPELDGEKIDRFFASPAHAEALARHLSTELTFAESKREWNDSLRNIVAKI